MTGSRLLLESGGRLLTEAGGYLLTELPFPQVPLDLRTELPHGPTGSGR